MATQFYCKNEVRWKKVRESGSINGIDYLEVASFDQRQLKVYFLHNLPGEPGGIPATGGLSVANVSVKGGVRVRNIGVTAISVQGNVLTVNVDKAGDFSDYTLRIGSSITDTEHPPLGFDQQLSAIDFSFKVNCPAEFDCKEDSSCAPDTEPEPDINYLAKDYASFNRLIYDRLSVIMPDWKERSAADLEVTLVELLAYLGDQLSYYQDAVATEAYLGTARRRISLRRHARLLDYAVHDGCNARAWVQISVAPEADGIVLPAGTAVFSNGFEHQPSIPESSVAGFLVDRDPVVFETMHQARLHAAHNSISFYTWEDDSCCLPKGATSATLDNSTGLSLQYGDVLIFEEVYSPATGRRADADTSHRHAVRLKKLKAGTDYLMNRPVLFIEWDEEDALPFSLIVSSSVKNEGNGPSPTEKSVARGNIVLADHGMTQRGKTLIPDTRPDDLDYNPRLPDTNVTVALRYDHTAAKGRPAGTATIQDPHKALPAVRLIESQEIWEAQKDLLASDRFATEFVVETEQGGQAFLRFGDDVLGRRPLSGFRPEAVYRVGNGREGNIGPEALDTVVWPMPGILQVRNPLAGTGGIDPESMEEVRQFAPQAFRTQERAITAADYAAKAELHPEVQKAAARFYWTGSWYTVYIIIDRRGGKPVDDAFREEIVAHLEQFRMAGYDLEIRAPRFVPLAITLGVCVLPGYFSSDIKQTLTKVLSNTEYPDGTKGFFHPDNFTFGQPVHLSAVYQAAMSVQGVASVEARQFQRWAKNAAGEIAKGLLQPSELEILRLDNDPSFPENGKIDFIMFGGI